MRELEDGGALLEADQGHASKDERDQQAEALVARKADLQKQLVELEQQMAAQTGAGTK